MKNKIITIMLSVIITLSSIPVFTSNAAEPDYSLWDKFIKYDLCITDYDSLTDEEKELCHFIFDTEQSSMGTVRCERARRTLAGDTNIGERIALEQLEGAYGIWDKYSSSKIGWHSYIHCVPDIKFFSGTYAYNEYWLDADGKEKVIFTGEELYADEYDHFMIYTEDSSSYSIEIAEMPFGNCESKTWNVESGVTLNVAEAIEYNNDYYYITPDNEAVLLKSKACGTSPYDISKPITEPHVIPDKINGYPVTAIESGAFRFGSYAEIILPETIECIDNEAFYYNPYLEKINFPNGLKFLGNRAFSGAALTEIEINCPELYTSSTSLTLSNLTDVSINAKIIGEKTFASCQKLKNVTIGENVERIGTDAFHSCGSIENISFNTYLKVISQGAFLGENWQENGIKSITIPPTVEIIGALPKQEGAYPLIGIGDPTFPLTDDPICVFDQDCAIYGYAGTEAEHYANEWGLEFVAVEKVSGDTNMSGTVDIADAVRLQSYLTGKYKNIIETADINGDGIINVFDMVMLRKELMEYE